MFDGRLPSNTRCGTSHSGVPFVAHLLGGLAEGQRLALGEHVGSEQVVMRCPQRVERVGEADEVDRDELGALVDQLVEAVLPVGARLAPVDRAGGVVDSRSGRA